MGSILAMVSFVLVTTGACILGQAREAGFLLLCIGVLLAFGAALMRPPKAQDRRRLR